MLQVVLKIVTYGFRDLTQETVFISEISRVEVLGYHKLTAEEETYFTDVFNFIPIITPSQEIFNSAIILRKRYNLKLGDSLIAATASVHDLTIYTRNTKDFENLNSVDCIDPLKT